MAKVTEGCFILELNGESVEGIRVDRIRQIFRDAGEVCMKVKRKKFRDPPRLVRVPGQDEEGEAESPRIPVRQSQQP